MGEKQGNNGLPLASSNANSNNAATANTFLLASCLWLSVTSILGIV